MNTSTEQEYKALIEETARSRGLAGATFHVFEEEGKWLSILVDAKESPFPGFGISATTPIAAAVGMMFLLKRNDQ